MADDDQEVNSGESATSISCPRCGQLCPMRDQFCSACGHALHEPADDFSPPPGRRECPQCGGDNPLHFEFCALCGQNLGDTTIVSGTPLAPGELDGDTEPGTEAADGALEPVPEDEEDADVYSGLVALFIDRKTYTSDVVELLTLRLVNQADFHFENIELMVTSPFLDLVEVPTCTGRVRKGEGWDFKWNFTPDRPGNPVAQIRLIYYDLNANPNVLVGAAELEVKAGLAEPAAIHYYDQRKYEAHPQGKIGFGWSEKQEIQIAGLSKLPGAEPGVPSGWEPIALRYDHEATVIIREQIAESRGQQTQPISVTPASRESITKAALRIHLPDGAARTIWLFQQDLIRMGRQREADIVCLVMSDSKQKQRESDQISRNHLAAHIGPGGMEVADLGSSNGTWIGDRRLPSREICPVKHGDTLALGGAFRLRVRIYHDLDLVRREARKSRFSSAMAMSSLLDGIDREGLKFRGNINAVRLRRLDGMRDRWEYVVVLKEFYIGRRGQNCLVIEDESVSEIQARVLCRDEVLYLVDEGSVAGTCVNGRRLDPGQAVPLSFGDQIDFGEVKAEFVQPPDQW